MVIQPEYTGLHFLEVKHLVHDILHVLQSNMYQVPLDHWNWAVTAP